jgi:hypothetical protein
MQNSKELWIYRIYFTMGKFGGPGARQVHHGPGTGAQRGLTGAQLVGCSGSSELTGSGQGRRSLEHERQQRGGTTTAENRGGAS